MPFLLMVLLMLACLPGVDVWPQPLLPAPFGLDDLAWSMLQTGVAIALVGLNALWMARRVVRPLRRSPDLRDRVLTRYERWRFFHQFALFALLGMALGVFGWGQAINRLWLHGNVGERFKLTDETFEAMQETVPADVLLKIDDLKARGFETTDQFDESLRLRLSKEEYKQYQGVLTYRADHALPFAEMLILLPFFAAMMLSWLFFYDADRASHQAAYRAFDLDPLARALLDPQEFEAKRLPVEAGRDFGGRWSYVLFQMRQKFALVLIPVGLLLVFKELQRRLGVLLGDWQLTVSFIGCACMLAAFVAMPWAVRLALGLKPLPPGPLRDRLLASARRLRFRFSNILLWNTRSAMGNAMVVGLLPWPRYVVFTDRLLEDFTPEEVEAVFGHEVGHVKHHHMLFYLGFLGLSMTVLGLLAGPITTLLFGADTHNLEMIPLVIGMVAYIFVVFGFVSRRCERQADVYGCRAVSCAAADCLEHGDGVALTERGRGLCPTGIRTFIRALEKVALVNGISRDRPGFLQSWQHSTIAKRVAFLQRLLDDPRAERTFQRRVLLVKCALGVTLGLILAALLTLPALWAS